MAHQILDTESLVVDDILQRQALGLKKYGTSVANNPLELHQWITHLYEELLDASVYCKRILQEIESKQDDFK